MILLPTRVMLRNRAIARVDAARNDYEKPWRILGWIPHGTEAVAPAPDSFELWTRSGKWKEDETPHHFDIVAVVGNDGSISPLSDQFSLP